MGNEESVEVRVSGTTEAGRKLLTALEQIADVEDISGPHPNPTGPGVSYTAKARVNPFNQAAVERDWLLAEAPEELRERFAAIKNEEREANRR